MNYYKLFIILISLLLTSSCYTGRNTYEFHYKTGNDFLLKKNRPVVISYTHKNIQRARTPKTSALTVEKKRNAYSKITAELIKKHWGNSIKSVETADKNRKTGNKKGQAYLFEIVNFYCYWYNSNSFQINIKEFKTNKILLSFSYVPPSAERDFRKNLSWMFENDLNPDRIFRNPL